MERQRSVSEKMMKQGDGFWRKMDVGTTYYYMILGIMVCIFVFIATT